MKCETCSKSNPDDHQYCGFCGRPLHHADISTGPGHQVEALFAAAVGDLTTRLDKIKSETTQSIKDNAMAWAKGLISLYAGALVIALVAFGVFGYEKIGDITKSFDDVKISLTRVEKNVEEKTNELLKSLDLQIAETAGQLSGLRASLGGLALDVGKEQQHLAALREDAARLNYAGEIQKLQDTVTTRMKEVHLLSNKLEDGIGSVRELKESLTKIDHALFNINVQYDMGSEQPQSSLETLLRPLTERGFILEGANILRISVNKSEVVYYSHQVRKQVRLIADALKSDFPAISTRFFDRKEKNAREILIKLTRH
ncbi:MAG: hypothetical protein P8X55_02290 [Desulfosarcinaceae bacterium]